METSEPAEGLERRAVASIAFSGARLPVWSLHHAVALVLTVVVVVGAIAEPTALRFAGAVGTIAVAVAAALARDHAVLRGRVAAAAGLAVLTLCDAGLMETVSASTVWRPLVAIVAYPVLGTAFLQMVGRYRLVRAIDVVAEAILIGAGAAILLEVLFGRWTAGSGTAIESAGAALPSLLVGLDVALLVIVGRSITTPAGRQGQPGWVAVSTVALLIGHVIAAFHLASEDALSRGATSVVAIGLATLGIGWLYAAIVARPSALPVESQLFSTGHAGVVVGAILAVPAVLTIEVLWGTAVSGAVALGGGLIGVVLASHVVSLMRQRATSEHQATHDLLTDLPNRLLFMDRLERAIAHASRTDTPVGVLYIDLDRFKDVNDTLGHEGGDQLLGQMGRRLISCGRAEDTVARLSGDEFAVLLPHLGTVDDILVVAERVLDALSEPVVVGKHSIRHGGSIGVAVYPSDGMNPDQLMNAADAAMYRAKERGGSTIELFSAQLHDTSATRLEIETELHDAIEQDHLVLHYQPIVDTVTGRTCGAEALVRWQHPEQGLLYPGAFVPVAEQSDLIVELGDWVIREACRELTRWTKLGCGDRFVTVNVSSRHFRNDLVSSVTSALRDTGADASRLVVELTESAAVDDVQLVSDRLHELRKLGVRAAIDDFGTGYCGLQYLGDLPVSTLKLDGSFVQAMTPRAAAIVAATIAMARSLGLTLVAEGVETEEQQRFLERSGCDRLQGFHLGRPMPSEDFVERMRNEDRDANIVPIRRHQASARAALEAVEAVSLVEPAHR